MISVCAVPYRINATPNLWIWPCNTLKEDQAGSRTGSLERPYHFAIIIKHEQPIAVFQQRHDLRVERNADVSSDPP
jgi:hypothetical protein